MVFAGYRTEPPAQDERIRSLSLTSPGFGRALVGGKFSALVVMTESEWRTDYLPLQNIAKRQ